jgi:hypothetical protein
LDPDPRAAQHARETVGVRSVCADFTREGSVETFDVVSFNKVLEHVTNPIEMLAKGARHVKLGGFAYIELPDAEAAWVDGPARQEFFIEHHHVFSMASAVLLANRAGFTVVVAERLREPSGKYTLRAFLVPKRVKGHASA